MAVTSVSKFYQVYFQLDYIFVSNAQKGEQSISVTFLSNSMELHSYLVRHCASASNIFITIKC